MVDYREILRLYSLGFNKTRIAEAVHSSRDTVRDVEKRARKEGIVLPLDESLTNQKLYELLYPERMEKVQVYMMPDFAYMHEELAKKGVNLTLLHTEYKKACASANRVPYQYTQFCEYYRAWALKTKATMRIQHKPGDAMEVDWAGATLPIYDSVTGDVSEGYLFIAVLPCSCYAYAELCTDEQTENWILCHVHAYEYFGGVPRLLIPDNLKTGIVRNTRLETVVNPSYAELADHYGTAIVPARVKAPKDKSHAEGTVKFASTWILAALRNERFLCFADAKEAVQEKLEDLNTMPFKKRKGNRREAYLTEEKEFMQQLPHNTYEPSTWSDQTVHLDYTVTDGLNKYSVPYDLIGEKVRVRITRDAVEVFFHDSRVAVHLREQKRLKDPVMVPSHMPENHRKYLAYNSHDFLSWASGVGDSTRQVVRYFLESGRAPEQGFKSCVSLMRYAERYKNKRVEEACRDMLALDGNPTIRALSVLLKKPLSHRSQESPGKHPRRSRGITRGADHFREGGDEQ